jgi:hypothetical protein
VEAIQDKESESSEEEHDRGKQMFVASVVGGLTKLIISTSSENERKAKVMGTTSIIGGL